MANIRDIAKATGVSVSTVSKALNGYMDVNAETRKKILKAVKDLDYLPNVMARGLITKKTNTIGVFFGDQMNSGFDHPFFSDLIRSIKDTAGIAGYDLMIFSNQKRDTSSFKTICYERGVDGVILILTGQRRTDEKILELHESLPAVYIDSVPENVHVNYVESENEQGAFEATEHLIKQGHRNILKIAGDKIAKASFDRISGYKNALQKHNIPVKNKFIQYGYFLQENAYQITRSIFQKQSKFSAIFASSDLMAFGAIEALKSLNYKVPHDVAVVGFDDIERASLYQPPLTTVHQQRYKMGETSTKILIEIIKQNDGIVRTAKIPTRLIIRESCGEKVHSEAK